MRNYVNDVILPRSKYHLNEFILLLIHRKQSALPFILNNCWGQQLLEVKSFVSIDDLECFKKKHQFCFILKMNKFIRLQLSLWFLRFRKPLIHVEDRQMLQSLRVRCSLDVSASRSSLSYQVGWFRNNSKYHHKTLWNSLSNQMNEVSLKIIDHISSRLCYIIFYIKILKWN